MPKGRWTTSCRPRSPYPNLKPAGAKVPGKARIYQAGPGAGAATFGNPRTGIMARSPLVLEARRTTGVAGRADEGRNRETRVPYYGRAGWMLTNTQSRRAPLRTSSNHPIGRSFGAQMPMRFSPAEGPQADQFPRPPPARTFAGSNAGNVNRVGLERHHGGASGPGHWSDGAVLELRPSTVR